MSVKINWGILEKVMADHPSVIAAWVFGSAQSGVLRPGGDLDIGVLFAEPFSLDQWAELRAALQLALGIDQIDLVALNDASPYLIMEAASGRAVYCRDLSARAGFVSLAARQYEDERALLEYGLKLRADTLRQEGN